MVMKMVWSPAEEDKANFVIMFNRFPNRLKTRQYSFYRSIYHCILRAIVHDDKTNGME
jgi:hypothetical protein